ncbi:MAG: HD domain-containing protein [Euryarchaeota archaeon]|nr:HD domain-containing protein [Euryarchaeota archaeon]
MLKIEKFIRDPLYGFIGLTKKEVELLGVPVVQRLRRIKQLGNTHLVYPGACHSRFEHTLGVLHIANRMAQKLELSDYDTEIIRYAAILHDNGKVTELDKESPIFAKQEPRYKFYIFCPEEYKTTVNELAKDIILA